MTTTIYDQETMDPAKQVLGVEYGEDGRPVGTSLEEWMDKLGNMLIKHYGEDFRIMLNEARLERGMNPL
jgi:hypothetical protein